MPTKLRYALFLRPALVLYCNPGVAQAIGYFRTEQTAIGADVDPESFSCRVVKHLVCELRAQKGFPAHQSKHAAAAIM